ncbi:MAG: carbon-nitrogen hydrolase family protein [Lachnospiraceae bacterium]|nr:carbon-nitrogen hydrolase family protein [Lachnospiraceae bacterium]
MKLAMSQMSNEGSMEQNLEKSLQAIREASAAGADLILFPEVQLTEFFPQFPGQDVKKYGITMDSSQVQAFCTACKEAKIYAVPNIYLKEENTYYDASLVIDPCGEIIGVQKMVHIAQAEQFYEQDYYAPSDTGFQVFDTELGKLGIVVCFDRHYPESIRTEALMGADLILIPTVNTKTEPLEMFEWELRVQAFHSSVAVAMCNRVGREADMEFAGESILVDAKGNVILKADDSEQIVYAEVDLRESGRIRSSRPYSGLRRPELYM